MSLTWQRNYWHTLSALPALRPVIDPEDADGTKNDRIDRLHRASITRFMQSVDVARVRHVLDFGCGVGRHHALLSSIADRYTGVDIAEGMVRRAPGDVRLIDGTTLPFADAAFDCIFSFWVLQHVLETPALERIAGEFRRCLGPGGTVVLCERSAHTPAERDRPEAYIRRRQPEAYVDLFSRHGLRLRRIRKIEHRPRWRTIFRRRLREGENLYAFQG